jgi:glucose/arabinose dehydrogenase
MGRLRALLVLALLALGISAVEPTPARAALTLPADFTDQLVTNVAKPTALAFTPDGRGLVATQPGVLRVIAPGQGLLPEPALDLGPQLCSTYERGLLGAAVDPDFGVNHHVFLFYTYRHGSTCGRNLDPSPENRVGRFTLGDDNRIDPASEVVVLDHIPSRTGQHNAGDLHFGADGLVYVSTGDGYCRLPPGDETRCTSDNNNSRSLSHLLGKILRVAPDGSVPAGNPYVGAAGSRRCGDPDAAGPAPGSGPCRETFAAGLRNPFRFAVRPGTSDHYINDVGQDAWDEIDLGAAGADYGWNTREGHCARGSTSNCGAPGAGLTNPIFDYAHTSGCSSITGGAFVPAGSGWPALYNGAYLYADYVCGKIFRLVPASGGGFTNAAFVTGLGASSATSLSFGPYAGGRSLFYTSYANGGEVRRITYTPAGHRPPVAAFTASVPSGDAPVEVAFDAGASSDPDPGTGALSYRWNFGDGSPSAVSATPTITHEYATAGTYTATLRVTDPGGLESSPVTRTVGIGVPNTAPTPKIVAPTTSTRFTVGQSITLKGKATDPEDGTLPAGALTWEVLIHHNNHTHPLMPPTTGNNVTFRAPPPENTAAAGNSYLEIHLTATDSAGLHRSVVQRFDAKRVTLTFKTTPDHLKLTVGGTNLTATKTVTSWVGYQMTVTAPTPQTLNGKKYRFSKWSDGKGATHKITTPSSNTTYRATFK